MLVRNKLHTDNIASLVMTPQKWHKLGYENTQKKYQVASYLLMT